MWREKRRGGGGINIREGGGMNAGKVGRERFKRTYV